MRLVFWNRSSKKLRYAMILFITAPLLYLILHRIYVNYVTSAFHLHRVTIR